MALVWDQPLLDGFFGFRAQVTARGLDGCLVLGR